MNRIYRFIIGSFFVAIVALSLATAQVQALDTRCDPEIWDIQKTQAQAAVVVDSALAQELSKKSDSTLAMSCFDQALKSTAKGGAIFSDVPLSGGFSTILVSGLTALFSSLASSFSSKIVGSGINLGNRGSTLVEDLNSTISDTMSDLTDDFTQSITNLAASLISTTVTTMLGGFLGAIAGGILLDFFGGATGLNAVAFDCNIMSVSWSGGLIGGVPVKGSIAAGVSAGTPYTSYDDIYNYANSGTPIIGMTAEFQDKLDVSSGILSKAWNDQNNRLTLGGVTSYKNVPVGIGVNSSLAAVLGEMP